MKKQALSLFLAGALALSLFGCSCGERRIWKDVL